MRLRNLMGIFQGRGKLRSCLRGRRVFSPRFRQLIRRRNDNPLFTPSTRSRREFLLIRGPLRFRAHSSVFVSTPTTRITAMMMVVKVRRIDGCPIAQRQLREMGGKAIKILRVAGSHMAPARLPLCGLLHSKFLQPQPLLCTWGQTLLKQ
jgi:hypothetical protein